MLSISKSLAWVQLSEFIYSFFHLPVGTHSMLDNTLGTRGIIMCQFMQLLSPLSSDGREKSLNGFQDSSNMEARHKQETWKNPLECRKKDEEPKSQKANLKQIFWQLLKIMWVLWLHLRMMLYPKKIKKNLLSVKLEKYS